MRCVVPDCMERGVHRHHVVYEAELKRRWASGIVDKERWPTLTRLLRDFRNLVDGCVDHHLSHHGIHKFRLVWLPDESLEFAFELMGPYAYDYLRRRYDGEDPRLEAHLAAATTAAA